MKNMKALQITAPQEAAVVEIPIPKPGPGQVLVKVKAIATCPQWDLHIFNGKPMFVHESTVPFPYPPGQPGHEMTGTVVEVGEGCQLKVNQKVSAWKDPGKIMQGCYAEYVVMEEKFLLQVPEDLHYSEVASLELAMCVASSVLKMKSTVGIKGKKCGVNGLGPAGLIALQMLAAEGAEQVVGIDPHSSRRDLAAELGVNRAYAPGATEILERDSDGALDIAIDCVGYPQAVKYIFDHTKEAVALFAVQRDDYLLNHKALTVLGYPGHYREAAEYALELIIQRKLRLAPLLTQELSFGDYRKGIELLQKQEAVKICFIPEA